MKNWKFLSPRSAPNADPVPRATSAGPPLTALKLALATAIVIVLFWYGVIDARALLGMIADPAKSAPSLAMLLVAFALGSVRWHLILRTFGITLPFRSVFEIYAIGACSNTFMPGATGGDVMRVVYVLRSVEAGKLRAAVSVFADRVIGLYGLLIVALMAIALRADTALGHATTRSFGYALIALFSTITLGCAVLLLVSHAAKSTVLMQSWEQRAGWRRLARMSLELVLVFRGALRALAGAMTLSVLISSLMVGSVAALARGYGVKGLDALELSGAAALASLAGAVPLTPGGIGIAEGAFAYICLLWSVGGVAAAYGTVFLGNRLLWIAVSLTGAIGFVTHRPHRDAGSARPR